MVPDAPNVGVVVSVRGSVVDMRFSSVPPAIHTLLRTGTDRQVAIEVLAQRDAHHIRGIALTPTQGLARGMPVHDTRGPLKAPVGKPILSRMLDVFGDTIDREPELAGVQWRAVHQQPPSLAQRSTTSEIFETGIKAIDVLTPRNTDVFVARKIRWNNLLRLHWQRVMTEYFARFKSG